MLSRLKLRPRKTQFEEKEGDFRFTRVKEINELIDEIETELGNYQVDPNYNVVEFNFDETDLATLGSEGIELIAPDANKFLVIKSIRIITEIQTTFLTPFVGTEFIGFYGTMDVSVSMDLLAEGSSLIDITHPSDPVGGVSTFKQVLRKNRGLYISNYSGEDFSQGVGKVSIVVTYEYV